ncbi:NAD-dependent 4,6-dehydratase LegB [Alteromonadaceae bacterium BrNp21-10]|nr:NAD-dependent 4,6-dehydratase LegB [Alteromonadaceae bacterium BrNp21-10]
MTIQRALVTGADGFIGSHLVELLHAKGYEITALVQYNSFNNWGWLEQINCLPSINVVVGDVRDYNFCIELCKDIDVIFHLAALIAIPYSYVAPQSYVDVNVNGTLNMCQAALKNNVKRFLHTSTSEVYGSAQYIPIDEKHPLQPQSPYSASKIAADSMAMSFYYSFELPVTIMRPFNTYGPRQSARAVIPSIISQLATNKDAIQLGDVSTTRDFNYVEDTCEAMYALAQCEQAIGQAINIGSSTEISIFDTFLLIKELMDSNVEFIQDPKRLRPKNSEVQRLVCDNSVFRNLTGVLPQNSIQEGLRKTIEWFSNSNNLSKYKSNIYNI